MSSQNPQVLICGAGPTGLVLALWLTKSGVNVRLIDKAATSGTTSRAMVMHARNLEFYHQLGIDQVVVNRGLKFTGGNLWVKGKRRAHLSFGDMGAGVSPYPFVLNLPQDHHEWLLEQQLNELGVFVERNTILTSFLSGADYVQAQLQKANGDIEKCQATYLAGCDGAHSAVRVHLGFSFPGGTYQEVFYVADLQVTGQITDGELHLALDSSDFLAVFPMKGNGKVRVIGTVVRESWEKEQIRWDDVSESIIKKLNVTVEEVNWFSSYRVHHRVATHFRKENVFLLGDAGHIHSPVGGQGMNTGIGDAVNLAWKLAAVIKEKSPVKLLDTYEPERIAFAQRLVATTDRAFTFVNEKSFFATQVRTKLAPVLAKLAFQTDFIRKMMFKVISQTEIDYRDSPLSKGSTHRTKGGDRLPWVRNANGSADNYEPLTSLRWQAHVYGDDAPELQTLCSERGITYHRFAWSDAVAKTGLQKNAAYLIRPDGYIGLAEQPGTLTGVRSYLDSWGIRKVPVLA